jgi:hypothetical protein
MTPAFWHIYLIMQYAEDRSVGRPDQLGIETSSTAMPSAAPMRAKE